MPVPRTTAQRSRPRPERGKSNGERLPAPLYERWCPECGWFELSLAQRFFYEYRVCPKCGA